MNLIINFSAREKGNCGKIAEFIKKRKIRLFIIKICIRTGAATVNMSVCRGNVNTEQMMFTHYTKAF